MQDNAATLGVIGAVFVGWTSLSLFSVLESAFNIVYGKPNRSFLHGKLIAVILLVGSLITLFVGLLAGSVGYRVLRRFAGGFFENEYVAYGASVLISTISVFIFLFSVYYLLTNEKLTFQEVLPGNARRDDRARGELPAPAALPPALERRDRAPGVRRARAPARLALPDGERDRLRRRGQLVARPRPPASGRARGGARPRTTSRVGCASSARAARARWEFSRFQSLPSSATVCSSPPGTKTGSKPKPSVPLALPRRSGPRGSPCRGARRPPGRSRRARRRSGHGGLGPSTPSSSSSARSASGPPPTATDWTPGPAAEARDLDPESSPSTQRSGSATRGRTGPSRARSRSTSRRSRAGSPRASSSSSSQPGSACRSSRSLFSFPEASLARWPTAPRAPARGASAQP